MVSILRAPWNIFCFVFVVLCSAVHARIYATRFDNVTWDDANWILQTTKLDQGHYQSRASLANGYIGINIAALGPFFEPDTPVNGDNINGWPLFDRRQTFATVAGFWDEQPTTNGTNFDWLSQYGGESIISGIPHWSGLILDFQGNILNASTNVSEISDFKSALNMKTATLRWEYIWTPPGCPSFEVAYSMFVHKLHVNRAAIRLQITSKENVNLTVYDVLDGDCAVRTTLIATGKVTKSASIWSAVQPENIPGVGAYVVSTTHVDGSIHPTTRQVMDGLSFSGSNVSSITQAVDLQMQANTMVTVTKFVGIASMDAFEDPYLIALEASLAGAGAGYQSMHRSHVKEWKIIMPEDSVDSFHLPDGRLPKDPNVMEQQIQAVANTFSLLQNTVGDGAMAESNNNTKLRVNSISVCGLTSSCYAGQIFWDVEVWMAPGLVVAFPKAARQIANYRLEKYAQAKANIHDAYTSSEANTTFSNNSAIFPWTSGRYGNCTAVGPCFDYEYHINGDIALELHNYYIVTGDLTGFRSQYFPIIDSVTQMYSDLLKMNASTGLYTLGNATDPDEYANHIDNPTYTMVLIKTLLESTNAFREQFGLPESTTWSEQASNLDIPVDTTAGIHLEYSGMNGSIEVKQADVVLIDDFLFYNSPYTASDLQYYAARTSVGGPGMTWAVFGIVYAKTAATGCTDYTYDLFSSQPYARAPWFQFSEQLTDDFASNGGYHPSFPFLTGVGGASRMSVFGYLGLTLRVDSLDVNPTLPPQIPYLCYRTLYWQGHAISASANQTHTTLTRLPLSRSLDTANPAYSNASIPVTVTSTTPQNYTLPPNGTLVLPNRRPDLSFTDPNNLAQCRLVRSTDPFTPGRFALAAVDGGTATFWQPSNPNSTATLLLHLGAAGRREISQMKFNWAQAPPRSFAVAFTNLSDPDVPSSMAAALAGGEWRNVTGWRDVVVSAPYDAASAAKVVLQSGNTTNVTMEDGVWGGRWAILWIRGSWAGDGMGATVGEWAIVGRA